jgi:hypothetical protein
MVDSVFLYMEQFYARDIQPYVKAATNGAEAAAADGQDGYGKDFITRPKGWDIYVNIAGHSPEVSTSWARSQSLHLMCCAYKV